MIAFLVQIAVMTIACVLASKFKTRESAAAWFDSLKLDWIAGVGLALGIVCSVCLSVVLMHNLGMLHASNP